MSETLYHKIATGSKGETKIANEIADKSWKYLDKQLIFKHNGEISFKDVDIIDDIEMGDGTETLEIRVKDRDAPLILYFNDACAKIEWSKLSTEYIEIAIKDVVDA